MITKTAGEGSVPKLTLENETSTSDLVAEKVSEPMSQEYGNAEDDGLWFSDGIRNQNCMNRMINSCSGESSRHHPSNRQMISGMKETEDFLAAEMNKLSMEERSKALDDVHCVGEDVQENPEEIERLLREYQTVVEKSTNEYYDLAFAKNPDFVQDIAFRSMFLRANLYNVKSAVKQMFRFLEQKMTYFGEEILAREISLSDLNSEDIEVILAGVVVLQKERDSSGRCVLYSFNHVLFGKFDVKAIIRAAFFLRTAVIMPHEEAQLKGVVSIYWDSAKSKETQFADRMKNIFSILPFSLSIPLRHSSVHYCLKASGETSALNKSVVPMIVNSFPNYSAVRTRVHCASPMELQYMLQDHGIRMRTYPMDIDGKLLLDQWKTVLLEHGIIGFYPEESEKSLIIKPTTNDVLLGRGRPIQDHPGVSQSLNILAESGGISLTLCVVQNTRMLPFGTWSNMSVVPMKRQHGSQGGGWQLGKERSAALLECGF